MPQSPELSLQRQTIRNHIRRQRRALDVSQQAAAAAALAQRLLADPRITAADSLALFLSFDGELDTRPLVEALWQRNKRVYLPALHPFSPGHLLFLRYEADTPLVVNRLHISEPRLDVTRLLPLARLDILFTPLVAFDARGQRLGMGGGFYDRTLRHWRRDAGFYPIGLAHDCQQVDAIPVEPWDIPLPEIFTPSRHWRW
ncbi:5-formyltetrahydrofolate cyclo-ligase [Acerihabitans arboris]|uniref:5-formyltetrahydrofolate cyclo-ligase n=1 Tax=Acerihabitans arboris TaxID=2691583 RepID=A0A845SH20_9GAMM|nr:5-formyltetrahydrofolate cyclo-ligase [Acerihabitans arboris]NDL64170.1 5-formyltetrahydrofolate cyclo-ligase [Acerihabitans arboris]